MNQTAQLLPERDTALAEAQGELEGLIGLPGVKDEVKRLMSFLKIQLERRRYGMRESSQSLHFVFTGNPGTGKTTVARILGKIFFGFGILKTPKVVECDRSRLVGAYLGQTAIKTDEVIQSALDGVLFIDEAYALAGDAAKFGHADMYGEEAINTLLKQMEDARDRLIVIAAGYPAPMTTFLRSNPGLESRFTRFIRFEDYSVPDLCRIFDKFCRAAEYSLTPWACAMTFVRLAAAYQRRDERFGNARYVRNVYEKALGMQADRLTSRGGDLSKSALATIDGQDILLGSESAGFDPRSVILPESKWEADCPCCGKSSTAPTRFLGQRVTCACGQKFIYPWWNLVLASTPGMPAGLIAETRSTDKLGMVDSVAASAANQRLGATPAPALERNHTPAKEALKSLDNGAGQRGVQPDAVPVNEGNNVGRVTFNLAENKRDPAHPFAFLATYASGLSAQGQVQHEALGRSVQQYAAAKNREALLALLLPLQRAAERSALVKELVASGDVYQALAWSPKEAERFLQDIPIFEESGLIVRVPDWLKPGNAAGLPGNAEVAVLAVTGDGMGAVSYCEIALRGEGRGRITALGGQIKATREAIKIAWAAASQFQAELDLPRNFARRYDVTVLDTRIAVKKDWPSAGLAYLIGIIGAFRGMPPRRDVAMTGEITIVGKVLAVEGIEEKLRAAVEAGFATAIIPGENRKDAAVLPANLRQAIKIVPVASVQEALPVAFAAHR